MVKAQEDKSNLVTFTPPVIQGKKNSAFNPTLRNVNSASKELETQQYWEYRKLAEEQPRQFLEKIDNYNHSRLKDLALLAASKAPEAVAIYYKTLAVKLGIESYLELFNEATRKYSNSMNFFKVADNLSKDKSEITRQIFDQISKDSNNFFSNSAIGFVANFEKFKDREDAQKLLEKAAINSPFEFIVNQRVLTTEDQYIDNELRSKALRLVDIKKLFASNDGIELLKDKEKLVTFFNNSTSLFESKINEMIEEDPYKSIDILLALKASKDGEIILGNLKQLVKDPVLNKIFELYQEKKKDELKFVPVATFALLGYPPGHNTLEKAWKLSASPADIFKTANEKVGSPDFGKYSDKEQLAYKQLQHLSAKTLILKFNELHNENDLNKRFADTSLMDAESLIKVITYGSKYAYTSTFRNLCKILDKKIISNGGEYNKIFNTLDNEEKREFAVNSISYDTFERFYVKLSQETRNNLTSAYFRDIEKASVYSAYHLSEYIDFLNIIYKGNKSPESEIFAQNVAGLVEQSKNQTTKQEFEDRNSYLLLSSKLLRTGMSENELLKEQLRGFKEPEINLNTIDKNKLFVNNVAINQLYFYKDADSHILFSHFLETFKQAGYKEKDHGAFIELSLSRNGKTIRMFANKTGENIEQSQLNQQAVTKYLTDNQLEPTIVSNRGHSYNAYRTIREINGYEPAFVYVGSCGGFSQTLLDIFDRAPDAQPMVTRGTGDMRINDPFILDFQTEILKNTEFRWNIFWNRFASKMNAQKDFVDYVPPHRNNVFKFIQQLRILNEGFVGSR